MTEIERLKTHCDEALGRIESRFDDKVEKLQRGAELPPGVLKMVKVFIAVKRKLQSGDKMAGRHGNKGVISRIVPVEDMPYLDDGTPVDVVLNPLGVPSRMNVGQILETHLGWASHTLGRQIGELVDEMKRGASGKEMRKRLGETYDLGPKSSNLSSLADEELIEVGIKLSQGVPMATPVFDGAYEDDIVKMLELAGLDGHDRPLAPRGAATQRGNRRPDQVARIESARRQDVGHVGVLTLTRHIQDRLRLAGTPAVSSGLIRRFHRGHHAVDDSAVLVLERSDSVVHPGLRRQDVALDRDVES